VSGWPAAHHGRRRRWPAARRPTVDGVATAIDRPYGSFFLENGPPSWPIIECVRR
jgi:hypothetical protein